MLIIFDLDNSLFDRLSQIPSNYTDQHINNITLFSSARKFLQESTAKKVMVTKETEQGLQNRKIDALKIRHFFDEIMICFQNSEKKQCFKKAIQHFPSKKVWVIGDRIDAEIRYGNELGCETIKIYSGPWKDLKPKDQLEIPNHTIYQFEEIFNIIR